MMDFGFLHPPLPVLIVKERQDIIKWLLGIIQDVAKGSALPVLEKALASDSHGWHVGGPDQLLKIQ